MATDKGTSNFDLDEPADSNPEFIPDKQDWFLTELVRLSNDQGIETGVILNVGGQIISGIVCSGEKYFSAFGSEYVEAYTDKEAAKTTQEYFTKFGEIYKTPTVVAHNFPAMYIHLRDAKFFSSSGKPLPGNRGIWWRGRISMIEGFSLGLLSVMKDK